MNIAIDGHAGSGKSVTAKLLAKKLNFNVFNTGAIYRTIACEWQKQKFKKINKENIEKFVKHLDISVKFINGEQHTYVNSKDYNNLINSENISILTPQIAIFNEIREKVREIQREYAYNNDCVMEGRDIGSEILPNADFKFFITAKLEIRAGRRYNELKQNNSEITFEEVLEDLKKRDYMDENREIAPLKIVKDSIIIDNTDLNIDETVDLCFKIINKKH